MTSPADQAPDEPSSVLNDAELEALRPGSTRPWNPGAASTYVSAVGPSGWHAVPRARAGEERAAPGEPRETGALCGELVLVPVPLHVYDRPSLAVSYRLCRACAWQVAIETGSTGRELALITPAPLEAAAIARSGADQMLAVRVCEAILLAAHRAEGGPEEDLDSPVTVALLALATRHRPVLFFGDGCAEGDCELRQDLAGEAPDAECSYPCAAAGCGACTPRAGQWAGSWEGSTLAGLRIPAPCSVLTVLAGRYLPGAADPT
jgi:hypothetical protein